MSSSSKIALLDDGLKRYYKSVNAPYETSFVEFCEDNGIDNDGLTEDLDGEDPIDSMCADFDDKFPFRKPPKDERESAEQKIKLLRLILDNPRIDFAVRMPKLDDKLFSVTQKDLIDIKNLYKKQCPTIYNSGMEQDVNFQYMLALGRKLKFDYLAHLVDCKALEKAQSIESENKADSAKYLEHLEKLKDVQTYGKPQQIAKSAVGAFGNRCCTELLYNNFRLINDSVEDIMRYIDQASEFVQNLIQNAAKENRAICPFQIDLCVVSQKPIYQGKKALLITGGGDSDDDDDDDDNDGDGDKEDGDDASKFVDVVGDIQSKLKVNNLKYQWSQVQIEKRQQRIFMNMFTEFSKEQKQKTYPHYQRFIVFIDRRPKKQKPTGDDEKKEEDPNHDDIWIYEPPANCRDIPRDTLPEWYINASRTCLLPNKDYGDGKDAEKGNVPKNLNAEQQRKANIGASTHCKGALLTLSFIAKEDDAIKAYLYWNGQIIRFIPKECKPVLRKIFNLNWNDGANKHFMDSDEMSELIESIDKKIHDKYFAAFCTHIKSAKSS